MTSIEFSIIQSVIVLLFAPVGIMLWHTIVTAVTKRQWATPWKMYRRSSSMWSIIALSAAFTLLIFLPLLGTFGMTSTDGSLFMIFGVLAWMGLAVTAQTHESILPRAGFAFGVVLLALAIGAGSSNIIHITSVWAYEYSLQGILLMISMASILLALRRSDPDHETVQDVRTIFMAVLAVFFVNMIWPIGLISTPGDASGQAILLSGAILVVKIFSVFVLLDVTHHLSRKILIPSPRHLLQVSTVLSIVAIAIGTGILNG